MLPYNFLGDQGQWENHLFHGFYKIVILTGRKVIIFAWFILQLVSAIFFHFVIDLPLLFWTWGMSCWLIKVLSLMLSYKHSSLESSVLFDSFVIPFSGKKYNFLHLDFGDILGTSVQFLWRMNFNRCISPGDSLMTTFLWPISPPQFRSSLL